MNITNLFLSWIGLLTIISFGIRVIINIINMIVERVRMHKMVKELSSSGFLQNTFKKMDEEEKEDLKKKGTGGKTVSYNFNTKKCEVKNEKQEKE